MLVWEPANAIGEWIHQNGGGFAFPGSYTAIGQVHHGELVGGITWSHHNGKQCLCNIALKPSDANPRALIRAGIFYSFGQLGLRRLTFMVSSANLPSQRFVRKLGAILEATLREADPSGDMLIFALFPENCKIWSRIRERQQRTGEP